MSLRFTLQKLFILGLVFLSLFVYLSVCLCILGVVPQD